MGRRREVLIGAAVLTTLVLGVFGQMARHPFITFDDPFYISHNPVVLEGLSREGLRWAFGVHLGNWHPLTWLSHMTDVQVFGLNAGSHHLVSVLMHAASTVLLFSLLRSLTGSFWKSLLAAAVFGIHPLRVESVAWAAERKDVLSTLFWFLTLTAWLGYVRRPGARRYTSAVALFALGLAAKPMVMTLPAVLLLLDWWPLGRIPGHSPQSAGTVAPRRAGALLAEKVPFLLLSAASLAITFVAQTRDAVVFVTPDLPTRVANALVSAAVYVAKLAWPSELAVLYPYPTGGIPPWQPVAAGLVLAGCTAAALLLANRRPYLASGWFWYLATLVPVVGLHQVGAQARADRYTYLPLVGVTIALVWLIGDAARSGRVARRVLATAAVAAVVLLAGSAFVQAGLWVDSRTLYEHTLRVTRGNYLILYNLGIDHASQGRYRDAMASYQEALRINPRHALSCNNLGDISFKLGRFPQAAALFERAAELEPANPLFQFNLGMALARQGHKERALAKWRLIKDVDPDRAARLHREIAP